MRVIGPIRVDLAGGLAEPVATLNPMRIGLFIVPVGAVATFKAYPFSKPDDVGISPYSGQTHVYLNRNAYPYLIGFDWYVYTAAPLTVYVVELVDDEYTQGEQ